MYLYVYMCILVQIKTEIEVNIFLCIFNTVSYREQFFCHKLIIKNFL